MGCFEKCTLDPRHRPSAARIRNRVLTNRKSWCQKCPMDPRKSTVMCGGWNVWLSAGCLAEAHSWAPPLFSFSRQVATFHEIVSPNRYPRIFANSSTSRLPYSLSSSSLCTQRPEYRTSNPQPLEAVPSCGLPSRGTRCPAEQVGSVCVWLCHSVHVYKRRDWCGRVCVYVCV